MLANAFKLLHNTNNVIEHNKKIDIKLKIHQFKKAVRVK